MENAENQTTKPSFPGLRAAGMHSCDLGSAEQKGSREALLGTEGGRSRGRARGQAELVWPEWQLGRGPLTHQLPDPWQADSVVSFWESPGKPSPLLDGSQEPENCSSTLLPVSTS